ncbi:MAG: heavy metal translocating P-type ATPase [Lepagella sp.]
MAHKEQGHNHCGSDNEATVKSDSHCGCGCGCHRHEKNEESGGLLKRFLPEIVTILMMNMILIFDFENIWLRLGLYIASLLPVVFPIIKMTWLEWCKGDFFNEFTLMLLASVGAFLIGEYPEGVAILLFYSIGEKLEDLVSGNVKGEIKRLLGKMPKEATVLRSGERVTMSPMEVKIGDILVVRPGESVALDGVLLTEGESDFNTAAITGESIPRAIKEQDSVNSGIIPVDREVQVRVTHDWDDSSMMKIIKMIEDASAHRAPSETMLRRITRWYTPLVISAAVLIFVVPAFMGVASDTFIFEWQTWLHRSLLFLVCSCPCALIVSIPLTYFSSIGIASRQGILFKGNDSMDSLRHTTTLLLDKTGTITTGEFHIERIRSYGEMSEKELIGMAASIERESQHPLAKAIVRYNRLQNTGNGISTGSEEVTDVMTRPHGMTGRVSDREVMIGSLKLMESEGIMVDEDAEKSGSTAIYIAMDGKCEGTIYLADTLKPGIIDTFRGLRRRGVKNIGILSGDTEESVRKVAKEVGADFYHAALLPEDKRDIILKKSNENSAKSGEVISFAGDGINDAPALAAAGVGIAMGSIGTDLAIESAQIVVAGDDLQKILEGIKISNKVKHVIIENVTFAFGVKIAIMLLGTIGYASLWAAVFADTGVMLLTVIWTLIRLKLWQLKDTTAI